MGLFSKKYCDICGEQIRFLGNRKVEDGNMCKDCAEKLSTWFSDRRRTTVADIRAQLEARKANALIAEKFSPTRSFGSYGKVQIDDAMGCFVALRSGMTLEDNPDVLDLSLITSCETDVREHKTEQTYRSDDGKTVSYDPPRFTYTYDFCIKIDVDHPYIDTIRMQLNRSSVKIEAGIPCEIKTLFGSLPGFTPNPPDLKKNEEYQRWLKELESLRSALLREDAAQAETEPGEAVQPEPAPESVPEEEPAQPEMTVCPCCTAKYRPDGSGKCPYCGA